MRPSTRSFTTLGRMLGCLLAIVVSTEAVANKLKVGDKAPSVEVKEWIQGQTQVGDGKPYVIEFWATWCGPCKTSSPHLNELYERYRNDGVAIIGITDEVKSVGKVRDFVRKQGEKMSYPVAIDGGAKNDWMRAAGKSGIPCAFIVDDKNTIAFIGHPMDDQFEDILGKVVEGRYNPKLEKQARPKLQAAERAMRVNNYRDAVRHMDEVIELDPKVFLSVSLDKYRLLKCKWGQKGAAGAWWGRMMTLYRDDAGALRAMARMGAKDPEECARDIYFARDAANRLLDIEGPTDPDALAVSAMVAFEAGEKDRAINEQMQAWMAVNPDQKDAFKRQLDLYRGQAGRSKRR